MDILNVNNKKCHKCDTYIIFCDRSICKCTSRCNICDYIGDLIKCSCLNVSCARFCNFKCFCDKNICVKCSYQCKSCEKRICNGCIDNCTVCSEMMCKKCVTLCKLCNKNMCESCYGECKMCNKMVCKKCSYKCKLCEDEICNDCINNCTVCLKVMCKKCIISCGLCNKNMCKSCYDDCKICNKTACKKCLYQCKLCKDKLCNDCINNCTVCLKVMCKKCIISCGLCNKNMCKSCYDDCKICNKIVCKKCIDTRIIKFSNVRKEFIRKMCNYCVASIQKINHPYIFCRNNISNKRKNIILQLLLIANSKESKIAKVLINHIIIPLILNKFMSTRGNNKISCNLCVNKNHLKCLKCSNFICTEKEQIHACECCKIKSICNYCYSKMPKCSGCNKSYCYEQIKYYKNIQEFLCQKCAMKCEMCNEITCHKIKCEYKYCEIKSICENCHSKMHKCYGCEKSFCHEHINHCTDIKEYACQECAFECNCCEEYTYYRHSAYGREGDFCESCSKR
jgi:hypothetical protein